MYLEVGVRRRDPLASEIIVGGQLLCQRLVLHHPLDVPLDHVVPQVGYLPGKPRLPGTWDITLNITHCPIPIPPSHKPGKYDGEHQLIPPEVKPPVDSVGK